ncbi:hypothetical protein OG884_33925 [Streptosporangium sp. NBC_01755]|uniref:hypothetical protein n=1 Tax=unclassified Streptosporangium TaxID=2632669 RepID=UPI002DD8FD72|nr:MULTISPECIES: hypothetical protein [unclassified Streptosporangium]WSA28806.1 hypothetical protein OIE13_13550 [Streptosporangium sp. NBC_01810]WSC99746.1 hypothetical protein OG884_33925 [Streptosporangium sp. NBC_01755]
MSVSPGHIRLHSAARPALTAGTYTVLLEHSIDGDAATAVAEEIEVLSPRFAIAGTEVASVFPPPTARGAFDTRLPEIVLKRRTLPWERRLGEAVADAPWLALVLLTEDEGEYLPSVPVTEVIPPALHATLNVGPGSGSCACLATTANVVHAVFPSAAELGLLCHVREVALDDTELAGGDLDGFFSVVLSARLPRPGLAYQACLISLEGRADALPGRAGTAPEPGPAEIVPAGPRDRRFPVLARWTFSVAEGGDFQSLAGNLDSGSFGTATDGCPGVTPTGHVATRHRSRRGEDRAAWYRGPLVPRETARRPPAPTFAADQARRIASDGLEDLSEAAAFEIGRLLALADPEFVAALREWRRADFAAAATAETTRFVPGYTDLGLGAPDSYALGALRDLKDRLGPPRPRAEVVITEKVIQVIADGLGLDVKDILVVLEGGPPAHRELPDPSGADPLETSFDRLRDEAPTLLAHLRRALATRVAATLDEAGVRPADGYDPAAPAATIDEVFS